MSDKPEQPDPKVVETRRAAIEEEHAPWVLATAVAEHFRAERSGSSAGGTPAAL